MGPWAPVPSVLLGQAIPFPAGESAWPWVAFVMALAFAGYWRNTEVSRSKREEAKDKAIEDLRAELQNVAKEAVAASAKQLEAAQEQARSHAREREVLLGLLGGDRGGGAA